MKIIRKINISTALILIGIMANSAQMYCMQRGSKARHAETVTEVEANGVALHDFAVKNHLIPPSTP